MKALDRTFAVEIRARTFLRVPDVSLPAAWAYWHRNAAIFARTYKLTSLAWFVEPVVYLVAMGFGLGTYLAEIEGVQYIDFIAPGLVALSAMYGATFEVSWTAYFKMDKEGIYDACTAAPLSFEDVALGEILWATTRATLYGIAFVIVAIPFGVVHSWWAVLAPFALVLVGAVFAVTGATYTYLVKQIDYLAFYWTLIITPQFMFSGTFFPLDDLPTVAPLRHAVEMMRALFLDGAPGAAFASGLWLLVVSALLLPVPLNVLRRRMVR